MTRALSTVVDVSLFLLLVSAAATVLVLSTPPPDDPATGPTDPADETVQTLATSTVRVNYSVGPGLAGAGVVDAGSARRPILERSAHGSVAGLLAEAAVATAGPDGRGLPVGGRAFAAAIANATERSIRREGAGTAVRATWAPYRGAPVRGVVRAGDRPPRDADARAATVVVDGGVPAARGAAIDAASRSGFAGVASVLADATVAGLFPPRETRVAVRGDFPTVDVAATRYERTGNALGVSLPPVADGRIGPANDALRSAFRDHYESDLSDRYRDPSAAARAVGTGGVTVVVRTWSR